MALSPEGTTYRTRLYLEICVLAVLLAYWPLAQNQFVAWDDDPYIRFNPAIHGLGLANLKWMFTNFHAGYWIPLTWLSLALDFAIGRLEPWVYHLDNLLLHCANTALVFLVCVQVLRSVPTKQEAETRTWAAFGTALLFGLHPLHVESVAWAAERKDLLCGLFYLTSLLAYLRYTSRISHSSNFGLSLLFFIFALLSKPMAVSLPFVLLILDIWPLGRWAQGPRNVLLEKLPFFLAAIASSAIAVLTQFQAGAGWDTSAFSLFSRLLNAGHSVVFYLWKMLFPYHLAAFYPLFPGDLDSPITLLSALSVLVLSAAFWLYRKKFPALATTWSLYLIMLAPVMGLVQVGNQAAADRFTYLPSLAPFLLASALLTSTLSSRSLKALMVILLLLLGMLTYQRVTVWKDTISLWKDVVKKYPHNNLIVYQNLANAYEDAGHLEEALRQYDDAITPDYPFFLPHWGKGRIYSKQGHWSLAETEFKEALKMNPSFPPLHSNLGMVYEKKGLHQEALAEVKEALRLDPNYPEAYNALGLLYEGRKQWKEAVSAFQKARSLDPENPSYLKNLLGAYHRSGQDQLALALYRDLSEHPRSLLTMTY